VKIYVYLCCQEKELEAFEIPVASVIVAACDRFRAFSENLVSRVEFGDCATQRNDSVLPHSLEFPLSRISGNMLGGIFGVFKKLFLTQACEAL